MHLFCLLKRWQKCSWQKKCSWLHNLQQKTITCAATLYIVNCRISLKSLVCISASLLKEQFTLAKFTLKVCSWYLWHISSSKWLLLWSLKSSQEHFIASFSIMLLTNFAQNSQDLRDFYITFWFIFMSYCRLFSYISLYEDACSHTKKPTDHSNLLDGGKKFSSCYVHFWKVCMNYS